MKQVEFHNQSGKSLVEILIVVVIGGILVAMAVMRVTNAQSNLERQNLAREFKVNLERSRFDAVKRRAMIAANMTRIIVLSDTSYKVWIDLNQDGKLDEPEERTVSFGDRSNVKILPAEGITLPYTILFDRFGNPVKENPLSAGTFLSIAPVFTFCEGSCTLETATVANSNVISLSPTGTVAMLNGGDSVPTFDAPTVTNVPDSTSINEWVVTRDENATGPVRTPTPNPSITPYPTGSPTATPTASPTATPSPSPTTSPSPSPSESPSPSPTDSPTPTTPTPTPTATPVYCTSGQKPSQTGCVCKLPMTVRTNGKCMQ